MSVRCKSLPTALRALLALICLCLVAAPAVAQDEDGYDLWLRYRPLEPGWQARYAASLSMLVEGEPSPTLNAAKDELRLGLQGMLGRPIPVRRQVEGEGAIVFGTPSSSPVVASLGLSLTGLGDAGYLIRTVRAQGRRITVIAANKDVAILYGAFELLRRIQTGKPVDRLDLRRSPGLKLRLLNHWDNLDRTVERGYSGFSLWDWHKLPDYRDPRYTDYARANASIGINGTVLTNVNADAQVLTPLYLRKVAALAEVFRPFESGCT